MLDDIERSFAIADVSGELIGYVELPSLKRGSYLSGGLTKVLILHAFHCCDASISIEGYQACFDHYVYRSLVVMILFSHFLDQPVKIPIAAFIGNISRYDFFS